VKAHDFRPKPAETISQQNSKHSSEQLKTFHCRGFIRRKYFTFLLTENVQKMLQNWAGLVCLCQTLAFALSTQTVSNIPVDNPDNPFLVKSDIPHKVNKRLKDNNLSSGCPGRTT